jgi:hypothetical protein
MLYKRFPVKLIKSIAVLLGARLMVGQRTLTPPVEVRVLCPQPIQSMGYSKLAICFPQITEFAVSTAVS